MNVRMCVCVCVCVCVRMYVYPYVCMGVCNVYMGIFDLYVMLKGYTSVHVSTDGTSVLLFTRKNVWLWRGYNSVTNSKQQNQQHSIDATNKDNGYSGMIQADWINRFS